MQQESHCSNGPSPTRPAGSLCFPKTTGLTIHKQKAEETGTTPTRRHTKVHLDSHRALHLTTHVFATSNMVPKSATVQQKVADQWSYPMIPECEDRLPPEVDLGILDTQPREVKDSVRSVLPRQSFD